MKADSLSSVHGTACAIRDDIVVEITRPIATSVDRPQCSFLQCPQSHVVIELICVNDEVVSLDRDYCFIMSAPSLKFDDKYHKWTHWSCLRRLDEMSRVLFGNGHEDRVIDEVIFRKGMALEAVRLCVLTSWVTTYMHVGTHCASDRMGTLEEDQAS